MVALSEGPRWEGAIVTRHAHADRQERLRPIQMRQGLDQKRKLHDQSTWRQ
jgi:hypothetical protein